jgi:hypothetical protein
MNRHIPRVVFAVTVVTGAISFGALARDPGSAKAAIQQDRLVAGGPKDFQEVRHLILKGTNFEIGQALATIGQERYQLKPAPAADALRVRAQRKYLEKNFPIHFDRMRGVAAAFGQRLTDDTWDLSGLGYLFSLQGGCSVMHFPPAVTADGAGVVSRDYDFSTGTIDGRKSPAGELPCTARPYVIEMHPDRGYASLSICAYDLLGGVLDGINSEGLTVALLADDELGSKFKMEPAMSGGVGLGVQQVLRMLLDTCANVEEAKEALLTTKQYYEFIPCHYLIADRHGNAFVWEYSQAHNKEHIIENPGQPLVTTNFSLHRHMDGASPPSAAKAKNICPRYCLVCERIAANKEKVTLDFIKETHKAVDATWSGGPVRAPIRTLWHALYVPERRSVQVSFYLRDDPEPEKSGKPRILRSDYLDFTLNGVRAAK